jgi:hypothetical protein
MKVQHENADRLFSSSPGDLGLQVRNDIQVIMATARKAEVSKKRFSLHHYLASVYATHRKWDEMGVARSRTRQVAQHFGIRRFRNGPAIRVLLEATLPDAGAKQLSRWTRALQFALHEDIPSKRILHYFRRNGGVAGCARLAAKSRRTLMFDQRWS